MGNSFHKTGVISVKTSVISAKTSVIPAKAGIHFRTVKNQWIPAFAGMI
jgi:hypothetical protein